MSALLDVRNLGVALTGADGAEVPVLHDVSLRVDPGEIVGIAGESGSGKSMTAQALLGLLPPGARTTGSIRLGDTDLLRLRGAAWNEVRGRRIAMIFQDATAALHPMLTVGRQITEHMRVHLGLRRRAAQARALELLELVRIPDPASALRSYPHQFSGGMRQRVAIAIALACDPELLIADEPTTALDVTVQAGILSLLDDLRREVGLSVLFITHDLGVLAALTARSYVFYAGRIMETGPTRVVTLEPRHPYTAALLGARPHADDAWALDGAPAAAAPVRTAGQAPGQAPHPIRRRRLATIPGSAATPASAPPGCPFAPRCGFRVPACTSEVPPLGAVGPGHDVACVVRPDLSAGVVA